MEYFYSYIKPIIFFLLLESLLLHIVPEGGFHRLLKLTCGMILVMLVISPISRFLQMDMEAELMGNQRSGLLRQYEDMMQQKDAFISEQYNEAYGAVVRESVEEIVSAQGYEIYYYEAEIGENGLSALSLQVGEQKTLKPVEKIDIRVEGGNSQTEPQSENVTEVQSPCIIKIRNDILDIYHIQPENLIVEEG